MNISLMYSVIDRIVVNSKQYGIPKRLSDLTAALNRYNFSQEDKDNSDFLNGLKKLNDVLESSVFNDFNSIEISVIEEMHIDFLIGKNIIDSLQKSVPGFEDNAEMVFKKINVIKEMYNRCIDKLEKLLLIYSSFSIEKHIVKPGALEVNIVYPTDVASFCLSDIEKEFRDINRILRLIAEVVGDGLDSFSVVSVGSSKLTIIVKSTLKVAICLSGIMTFVLNSYSTYLDIQKKSKELQEMGISEEALERVRKDAEDKYLKRFDVIVEDIIKKHLHEQDAIDLGRKNELIVSARDALTKLSEKIMKGVDIDVSAKDVLLKDNTDIVNCELYNNRLAELRSSIKNIKRIRQSDDFVKRLVSAGDVGCQS